MRQYAHVVGQQILNTSIRKGTVYQGTFYSNDVALQANSELLPEVSIQPSYDPLTQALAIDRYEVNGNQVDVIYVAIARNPDDITADKQAVIDQIEQAHDEISKRAVGVDGINYQGGWQSAVVINGSADMVVNMGGSSCSIVDATGTTHALSIAETRNVATQISIVYQTGFMAKVAALTAAISATNQVELDAALSGFVAGFVV
ncbi:hypothetical protein [Neptunomonas sp.]|uniref:hypothetical protein n=1 Tax=Neptunomonas sp. TaxID=1971898 RepID=UPI0025F35235|nr:hypothetical protein [Neptunomonas sp.]